MNPPVAPLKPIFVYIRSMKKIILKNYKKQQYSDFIEQFSSSGKVYLIHEIIEKEYTKKWNNMDINNPDFEEKRIKFEEKTKKWKKKFDISFFHRFNPNLKIKIDKDEEDEGETEGEISSDEESS